MKSKVAKIGLSAALVTMMTTGYALASTKKLSPTQQLEAQYPISSIIPAVSGQAQDGDGEGLDQTYDTAHFEIHYTTSGVDQTTSDFAKAVGDAAENAYHQLVIVDGLQDPITNKIPINLRSLGRGANGETAVNSNGIDYMIAQKIGTQTPLNELPGLMAHEITHIFEYFYYQMDDSQFMVESVPTWNSFDAAPNCDLWEQGYEWYQEPDVYLSGNRMGSILFLMYLEQKYGITIKEVMTAETQYKDTDALRAVLATKGVTLEQAFKSFSVDALTMEIGSNKSQLAAKQGHMIPAYVGNIDWNGRPTSISKIESTIITEHAMELKGQPLNVRNTFGVNFIKIMPWDNVPIHVSVNNPNLSISLIGYKQGNIPIAINGTTVTNPMQYQNITVSIVKLKPGSGVYNIILK